MVGGYYTSVKMPAVLRKNRFPASMQVDINKTHFIQGAKCSISRRHAAAKQRRKQRLMEKKEGQELNLTKEF